MENFTKEVVPDVVKETPSAKLIVSMKEDIFCAINNNTFDTTVFRV